ncbi:MAG: MBL fold metallo-hydrolase [Candidatus Aminicenantes bacterium]|nr:MAG: MBL fold metallo-hydrolase [Candidatus Aminicenantes bacterium]
MKYKKFISSFLALICLTLLLPAQSADDIPIQVKRLGERVIVLKETFMENNVVAIASKKGLVVVDTTGLPSTAAKMRKIIEKEFDRKDFVYVINTHHHWDHSFGNQVFADAVVVGHERCLEPMRRDAGFMPRRVEGLKQNLERQKQRLEGLTPDSEEAKSTRTDIATLKRALADYSEGFVSTPPAIIFNDRMNLNLGDMTFKLYYFGRAHSGSDILIHVPEEGLLLTGDLFLDEGWLPLFAGQPVLDIPRWIEVLKAVLDGEDEIKQVIPAHQHFWNRERLAMWRDYIVKLWNGVNAAKAEGLDFAAVQNRFPLEEKYSYLKELGHTGSELQRFQSRNVEAFWRQLFESAAAVVEKTITESGIQAAIEKYHELKAKQEKKYYFGENDFNALGYRLLMNRKVKEAIEVFKLNVQAFPDSWNVYDSLGEAYLVNGDTELAVKYYKKSLELNPENNNAKETLKRLEKK